MDSSTIWQMNLDNKIESDSRRPT